MDCDSTRNSDQRSVFFDNTQPFVFKVEDAIFWADLVEIKRTCQAWDDLLSGIQVGLPGEGTLERPAFLPDVEINQFRPFLQWLRCAHGGVYTEADLINMLAFAAKFDSREARVFCFDGLKAMKVPPIVILSLACQYQGEWEIRPCIEAILRQPIAATQDPRANPRVCLPVIKAKAILYEVTLKLATSTPPIPPDPDCWVHDTCASMWALDWRDHVVYGFFREKNAVRVSDCHKLMSNARKASLGNCRWLALSLLELNGNLDVETRLLDSAIKEICAEFGLDQDDM